MILTFKIFKFRTPSFMSINFESLSTSLVEHVLKKSLKQGFKNYMYKVSLKVFLHLKENKGSEFRIKTLCLIVII